ncbi:hypothetical protein CROQUDRAFT_16639, partial [Cronartium quercuum f. sp. fusiforme G11]
DIALLQAEAEMPQKWNKKHGIEHIVDARLMLTRPAPGTAHTMGHHSLTTFSGCGSPLSPLGIIALPTIFPHTQGAVRIQPEFVVMEN